MANITRRGDVYSEGPPMLGGLQRLNRMLDEAFGGWPSMQGGTLTSAWIPACDVCEDRDSVTISVELPGVRPEDVKLTVETNVLTVRGEKREETRSDQEQTHRAERTYGWFERAFALPSTVDPEQIEARYENGILRITIRKADRARPREIPVTAGARAGGNEGASRSAGSRRRNAGSRKEQDEPGESAS
ncbi:MAG TPA: Hsp20/alpha crystallin family protein [Gemmatimonadales bacterium]|nr:Hsp20/alpha crystallin family protein [Gemmatimonadales bacterium]